MEFTRLAMLIIMMMIIIVIIITKNYTAPLNFKTQKRYPDHRLLVANGSTNTGTDILVVFLHAAGTKVNTLEHVRITAVESTSKMTPEVGPRPGVQQFGVDLFDVQ